ncbi:BirA family biotin operon repressor/biotin-[acetyl-CoA-carboxylase] ligase [Pseudacidovorax intermedius]|uniref:BirA family biotin operon repressor/biotin-[acetyl-CoA-carboxylase] ligase n=1 Tax=Pseudacidovorax intermedius TaxID=433924 RepID=A0A370FQY9_9BURK|nr:BirA family biotin operon repressor/biotin-[acetyl-CoA-carboxylase] ligase [Pseudacidovorax intermedius]
MAAMSQVWPVDALQQALAAQLPSLRVEVVDEIASTNTELMRRARAGDTRAVLLVAERQTAGRGRLGRQWEGGVPQERAASLMFSLSLPLAPRSWSGLSLAVGVSAAESLDPLGNAGVQIKWPNDLWVQDRKLAGILIETASTGHATAAPRQVVIGIGINIGPRPADAMRTPPAWVRQWAPQAEPASVLLAVAPALLAEVLRFADEGFAPVAPRFAARDALLGRDVHLSDGTAGRCEGVAPDGELRIATTAGLRLVDSAEVSVRPLGQAF